VYQEYVVPRPCIQISGS